ncbi:MAG TPA: asparaginase domain-containing protein [Cellulomonas sp.]|uniref:asparaginase domain-containing protein n=1 Tax=Cellulomonas sp. TaxID=40001 RepID=UPI002E352272|nr:asparaginase domain-containing protein [Cellulomonas sp.]HEX5332241.1 asparaginase domain-containing protein [Cellulomonas sp.]
MIATGSGSRLLLLTLGGTIGSESGAQAGVRGLVPITGADAFVAELAPWLDGIDVVPRGFRMLPSSSLLLEDLLALRATIEDAAGEGFDGVVVAQGTDTLEETAFVLDVLGAASRLPVVVTGAMRDREAPGPDGHANLVAAIDVARSPDARRHGVLVTFADEVHAGRYVRKRSATHSGAFTSAPWGPLGLVHERQAHLPFVARSSPVLAAPPSTTSVPAVALIGTGVGDDLRVLQALPDLGYAGAVLEGMGGGHVSVGAVEAALAAATSLPLVLCSRAGVGPTMRGTYGYPGGEIDLLERGLLWGGFLTGPKARLLLTLCLMSAPDDLPGVFGHYVW